MPRITRELPSWSNVTAGSTATLELPKNLSYHLIHVYFSGVTLAQMKNIRLEINGKPVKQWADGNRLNMENTHYGRGAATADCLPIFFTREELATLDQRRVCAIGTEGVQTLTLLIDIDAAATSPSLDATAVYGPKAPVGLYTHIVEFQKSSSVSGEVEIDNIPMRKGAAIAAIHIYKTDVTSAKLEVNGGIVFDMTKTGAAKLQTDYGRTPQSSDKMSLDFLLEGDLAQAVQLANIDDFRLKVNIATAGSFTIGVEYLEQYMSNVVA
jgi:hypothetical protein